MVRRSLLRWLALRSSAWLLAVWLCACLEPESGIAPTQVMLRIDSRDRALIEELTELRISVALQKGSGWGARRSVTIAKDALLWPVDVPVLPRNKGDDEKTFEVLVEALAGSTVLAQARAVTAFTRGVRNVLPVELFICPDAAASELCDPADCQGPSCRVCTPDGDCVTVGVTPPKALPPIEPNAGGQTEPHDARVDEEPDGGARVDGSAGSEPDGAPEDATAPRMEAGTLPDSGVRLDSGGAAGPVEAGLDANTSPREGGQDANAAPTDARAPDTASPPAEPCPGLPAVSNLSASGPFDARMFANVGPNNNYHLFRPDTGLGRNGFRHPMVAWGNSLSSEPRDHQQLLGHVASHGFVVIACNDKSAERPCLAAGLDWLVQQNSAAGALNGKLDTSKEIALGYSWGGGAAIDVSDRPNIKATISLHGMPPRVSAIWDTMRAPLLLTTSQGDTFVSAASYVMPNYNQSLVPTFFATLQENVGHAYVCDTGSLCATTADIALGGPAAGADKERAPVVAWMRWHACGDTSARAYFTGASCTLCSAPWSAMRKPASAFQ